MNTITHFTPQQFCNPIGQKKKEFSSIQKEILSLKKDLNAIILAHNYQIDEIQEIADFVGDSLGLSYKAAETDAEVIVFCGVHFMAETAKIINPNKKVLLPDLRAGCSLSDSCDPVKLAAYQEKNPELYTVAYINCSAGVKALSDLICTSGNAVDLINKIPADKEILFVPDQNLGQWVASKTGRQMQLWPGSCYTHVQFTRLSLEKLRMQFPGAPIVAHPECIATVRDIADEVCSTEKMVHYCKNSPAETFIIVTETGMLLRLQREIPGKTFIAGPTDKCACNECVYMKMNTIEKLRDCMLNQAPEIILPEEIRKRAFVPIERMLAWSK